MDDISQILKLALAAQKKISETRIEDYEPYEFQVAFHNGKDKNGDYAFQKFLQAANQVGKTLCAASEVSFHATGDYPPWYKGRRLEKPLQIQVSGVTNETTRDICQAELLGDPEDPDAFGTGTIPKSRIVGSPARKSGIPNAFDSVKVRHKAGHTVTIKFRAYEAGFKKFMGHRNDLVWADEEPPPEIWSQMNRSQIARPESIILATFTPENGTTQLVNQINDEIEPGQCLVIAAWEDAPHIAGVKGRIKLLLGKFSPHEREMRSKGIPLMGAGLVFPIEDDRILIDPIPLEPHWKRINGMDFGWDHPTGVAFLAYDDVNDVVYLVDEYCESKTLVPVTASAIKHRGEWIPTMWPHDGMSVGDKQTGKAFKTLYEDEGVNMHAEWATHPPAPGAKEGTGGNSVEAGLMDILNRMETGRFKVFRNCTKFIKEKGQYHRKVKNGKSEIVKFMDDVISACRYGIMMLRHARTEVIFIPQIKRRIGPRMPHA
jgi:phage terminase large subunit-like protein